MANRNPQDSRVTVRPLLNSMVLRSLLVAAMLLISVSVVPTVLGQESDPSLPGTPVAVVPGDTDGGSSTGEVATETPTPLPTATTPDQPEIVVTQDTFGDESVSSGDVPGPSVGVEVATELLDVTITVWMCDVDPGALDPATIGSCSPDADVQLSAAADGVDLGISITTSDGEVILSVPPQTSLRIAQDWSTIETGYAPRGSGVLETVVTVETSLTFINLPKSATGRFQISSGQCPTLDAPYTQFFVLGPMARSAANGCEANGYAEFTISGDGVGGSTTVVTDESGDWRGNLPAGDYTISNDSASADFSVQVDATTVVIAVDYYAGPRGTLTVERYECSEGDTGGVQIDVYYGGGGLPLNASCLPSAANVEIYADADGVAPIVADLGEDGQTTVEVAAGPYLIRDSSGAETTVDVTEAGWTQAIINVVTISGAVAAQTHYCPDPASNFEDASVPDYWETECQPGSPGEPIAVVSATGDVAASAETGGEGSAYFPNLPPGTYELEAGSVCALFANGVDARGGFTVSGGASVRVEAFGCAAPAPVDPPPGGGGGSNGGGSGGDGTNGTGGSNGGGSKGGSNTGLPALGESSQHSLSVGFSIPTAAPASVAPNASRLYVDTLPSTGEGASTTLVDRNLTLLTILAALVLSACMAIRRRNSAESLP